MEYLSAGNDQLDGPMEPLRSDGDQNCLHLQRVLLAKTAAGKG
jgi:hypothetical protein